MWCGLLAGLGAAVVSHLVLQRCEADEAQEELSSRGHGHRGVLSCQAVCGPFQALPQAQDGLSWEGWGVQLVKTELRFTWNMAASFTTSTANLHTFVSLEEFEQSADSGHSRGHVRVLPHLSPEILHQIWTQSDTVNICAANINIRASSDELETAYLLHSSWILKQSLNAVKCSSLKTNHGWYLLIFTAQYFWHMSELLTPQFKSN